MIQKRKTQISFAILSAVVALTGLIFLCVYLFYLQNTKDTFTVDGKNNVTYLVYQKNNPYISEPYLGPDKNYLQTYTDYIATENSYRAHLSDKIEVGFHYRAVVTLIARYNKTVNGVENPEVLEKEYEIDSKSGRENTDVISMQNKYDLHLEQYRRQLEDFAATVNLPISGEIRVDFIMDLKSAAFESNSIRSMTIPLTTEFYNITISGDKNEVREYYVPVRKLNVWAQIGIVLVILASFWVFFVMVKRIVNNKSLFRQTIDDYLHTYDDIIINSETTVDFSRYENIRINSLKELIQLSMKLDLPIIFVDEKHLARFYVTNENIVYVFEMKESDHMRDIETKC